MALIKEVKYSYNDVSIVPCVTTDIEHRRECVPVDDNGMLPLFTSPMDTVVNETNYEKFESELIYPILPRTVSLEKRVSRSTSGYWAAYSLDEFEMIFCDKDEVLKSNGKIFALIDTANGHMKKILEVVEKARKVYGDDIVIMAGNVANPETYLEYAKAGVDYARLSIGTGGGCLTTPLTGIHYGIASLIDETAWLRKTTLNPNYYENVLKGDYDGKYKRIPKIVADGGIRDYGDIMKALALGADYVMCGTIFASMLESAAPKFDWDGNEIESYDGMKRGEDGMWYQDGELVGELTLDFYGMASREGQIALNGSKTRTSEGLKKKLTAKYTMHGWVDNFIGLLRSCMSYLDAHNLKEIGFKAVLVLNSEGTKAAVNK